MSKDPNQLVRIRSDGQVSLNPGGVIRSFCQLDLFLFPYDVQKCHIELEAWRYKIDKQHFTKITVFHGVQFLKSEEWNIINVSSLIKIFNYSTGSFDQVSKTYSYDENIIYKF